MHALVAGLARRPTLATMTTHTTTPPTNTTTRFGPRAAVLIATVGPLSIAALRGLLPYDTVDDATTIAVKVAAHPTAQAAVLWLSYLALLTMPLAVLIVSRVAMRARPVLGTVAAVIAWIGFTGLAFLVTPDLSSTGSNRRRAADRDHRRTADGDRPESRRLDGIAALRRRPHPGHGPARPRGFGE